ncbi:MAG: porin [Gammaproteobacteria bacterium]|nr:porin [Gammaproteobacteria bacterium]
MDKKLVAVAVASALAMPMAAQAVKYSASGQVNRAIMFADDGQNSDTMHVDGDASGTRFRFTGSEDIGNGLTAGFRLEIEAQSNDSGKVTMKNESDAGGGLAERHWDLYFSGDFGTLTLGQGSDATDGVAFADLNNAWIAVENATDFGCAIEFRTGSGASTGVSTCDVTPSYDGGRRDRVRYDTPAIGPLSAAVSHATDDRVDGMIKVAGSAAGGAYDVRAGYANVEDGVVTVSGAFKFAQGSSIAAAWGQQSFDAAGASDADYYYIKLGHDWGNNSVAVDYKSSSDNGGISGADGSSWGIGAVHTMPKPGIDLYAGYRWFELDVSGVNADDVSVFFVGSRIKFN